LCEKPLSAYLFLSSLIWDADLSSAVQAADVLTQVLAFYYGWYGNPQLSRQWHH
jgi:hypothetical protein